MKTWATDQEIIIGVLQTLSLTCVCVWLYLHLYRIRDIIAGGFLICALACLALGDLFSELYMILRGSWPPFFSAADIAWIGCFCFFIASHLYLWRGTRAETPWYSHLMGLATIAVLALYTLMYGNLVTNLLYAVPMAIFSVYCGNGLKLTARGRGNERLRTLYISMTSFIILDLVLLLSKGVLFAYVDIFFTVSALSVGVTFYRGMIKS